jgi:hypothetical protein
VCRAKLEELKNLLFKKHIIGKVKACVCCGVPEEGLAPCPFSPYYGAKV